MFDCKSLGIELTQEDLQRIRFDSEKDLLLDVAFQVIRDGGLADDFNRELMSRLEKEKDIDLSSEVI